MNLISIIVPVFKIKEEYLRKCIEGLISQTMKNIEIILIDDGSPDSCGSICDEYSLKYKNIYTIHQKNQGVSVARNQGILNAAGKYIMFVDADDVLKAHACEFSLSVIEKTNSEILIFKHSNTLYESETGYYNIELNLKSMELSIINKLKTCFDKSFALGSPWSKLFNRQFLIDNNLLFKTGLKKAQDREFMLRCLEYCNHVTFLNYDGYYYNTNEESICWRYNPEIDIIAQDIIASFEDYIYNYHYKDKIFEDALNYLKINVLFEILHLNYFHKRNKRKIFIRYSQVKKIIYNEDFLKVIHNVDIKEFGLNRSVILWLIKFRLNILTFLLLDINKNIKE